MILVYSLATVEGAVADVAPGYHKDDVLSDVRGVIANALEILGHE